MCALLGNLSQLPPDDIGMSMPSRVMNLAPGVRLCRSSHGKHVSGCLFNPQEWTTRSQLVCAWHALFKALNTSVDWYGHSLGRSHCPCGSGRSCQMPKMIARLRTPIVRRALIQREDVSFGTVTAELQWPTDWPSSLPHPRDVLRFSNSCVTLEVRRTSNGLHLARSARNILLRATPVEQRAVAKLRGAMRVQKRGAATPGSTPAIVGGGSSHHSGSSAPPSTPVTIWFPPSPVTLRCDGGGITCALPARVPGRFELGTEVSADVKLVSTQPSQGALTCSPIIVFMSCVKTFRDDRDNEEFVAMEIQRFGAQLGRAAASGSTVLGDEQWSRQVKRVAQVVAEGVALDRRCCGRRLRSRVKLVPDPLKPWQVCRSPSGDTLTSVALQAGHVLTLAACATYWPKLETGADTLSQERVRLCDTSATGR